MAYTPNNWVDREGITRYFETVDEDGALIFTPDYTQVTELGTPVNADNMNHIEEGIENHENRITVLEEGYDTSNFLNTSQITNCLLEVPQRIKYDLTDGTLTIKAGTVVIVPYGVEDLTADYPVGSTFLNDNFKVVDTQYADSKFFVWCEVLSDISRGATVEDTDVAERCIYINISTNIVYDYLAIRQVSGASPVATGRYAGAYNTTTNLIGYSSASTDTFYYDVVRSFPLIVTKAGDTKIYKKVLQVFDGLGYIGSTYWVDKGVKGLVPNGRNTDGSLNNIESTRTSLNIYTFASTNSNDMATLVAYNGAGLSWFASDVLVYQDEEPESPKNYTRYYSSRENIWRVKKSADEPWGKIYPAIVATCKITNGVISNFQPKNAFRAVDYNDAVLKQHLSEAHVVIETYQSGTSWYRVWSDGWCEQGGYFPTLTAAQNKVCTFLKPFRDTNYNVSTTVYQTKDRDGYAYWLGTVMAYTATYVQVKIDTSSYYDGVWWRAEGYIS